MKKLSFLFLLLASLSLQAQFVQMEQKALIDQERAHALAKMLRQPMANTGNYDIKYHRLELSPSLTDRNLQGKVTTYFVPNQNISQIEFDFTNQMTVQSVQQRGVSLNFNQTNNRLVIDFPQSVAAGTLDSLSITYNGNVPQTGLGSYNVTTHNGKPIVWTLSEPYGARDWWPCKQDLTDKADSIDIILQYPKIISGTENTGVSNGLLTDESFLTDSNSGTEYKISTWKHRYPIAAYLVAFAITNYTKFSQTAGIVQNFPIDNYVYPENLTEVQNNSVDFLPVMNYFEQTFGPYPFNTEKYGQIQFGWGGGMEHQTATFLVNYSRYLVAHELAHQWFGDAVTCGSWHDIWINEGFATYGEALTREELDGEAAFNAWKQYATSVITSEPGGSVYVQDTTDVWRIFDGRLSYKKGAMVLNMLRMTTGDTDFFQGLRNYVNNRRYGYAKTPDFKADMEAQTGLNLTEFFNDWIYGAGYPTYSIQAGRVGVNTFELVVNQTTSDPSVTFFEMKLPFKFTDNNGHVFETKLDHTTNGQHFIIDAGFEATAIEFDPNYDIVKGNTNMNVNLAIDENALSTLKLFPNPADQYFWVQNETADDITQVRIYSLDGKLIKTVHVDFQHIDINNMSQGVYLIHIHTKSTQIVKKLIVR